MRSMILTAGTAGVIAIGLCVHIGQAGDSTAVRYQPTHPLADAAGYVAVHTGAPLPMARGGTGGGGETPPDMPGWPVNIANYLPQEGAVLVQADDDPAPEVLLSTLKTIHLLDTDGTYLPGWPKTVGVGSRIAGAPSFGDVDGDGEGEVVVNPDNWPNGSTGWIYAYNVDGTVVDGFPFISNGDHARSPTVSDLDGDGSAEIIVGERDWPLGKVYVVGGDGNALPNWPQDMNHVPASSAGAADIDGDGMKEVLYQSFTTVYAFELNGDLIFQFTPPNGDTFSWSAFTFADVNNDGDKEIAFGAHQSGAFSHGVYVLEGDGTPMPGWPKLVDYWVYAPPTFADLDGDADLEVIVGDQVLSSSPTDYVYAWHIDGSSVDGFPIGPINAINAQVAVADIDGDGDPELFWDDNTTDPEGNGKLLGYHHDGTAISGWPVITDGTTFFNTVCIADADSDGDIDMVAESGFTTDPGADDTTVYFWDFPDQASASAIQMPMFQYTPGRDGVMPTPQPEPCPADIDGGGSVGVGDLLALLGAWGPNPGHPADLDGDDVVGIADLLALLADWGPCP